MQESVAVGFFVPLLDDVKLDAVEHGQVLGLREFLRIIPEREIRPLGLRQLVGGRDGPITRCDLLSAHDTRLELCLIECAVKLLLLFSIVQDATECDGCLSGRNGLLELHLAHGLPIQKKRCFASIDRQGRQMPMTGFERLLAEDLTPAVLLQVRLHFAIRFDGDAPLAFIQRIAIFADDHLLRAFEHIRIEPHGDGEAAVVRCGVLHFDDGAAIQHEALADSACGSLEAAVNLNGLFGVIQFPSLCLGSNERNQQEQQGGNRFHGPGETRQSVPILKQWHFST